ASEDPDRETPAIPVAAGSRKRRGATRMIARDVSPEFLHPPHWKRPKGYANGVVAEGRTVFVAGQIGWNAAQSFESEDFVAQVRRALENVVAVIQEAGGAPAHVTRLTWYI